MLATHSRQNQREREEWEKFYEWYGKTKEMKWVSQKYVGLIFHETTDLEKKSNLVAEALQAGVMGG